MDIRQVTVFGGTGMVGRHVVRALAERGMRVRVAVRHPELADFTRLAGDVGQVMPMRANLRFPRSVAAAIEGSDAVVNAAGVPFSRGRQSYDAVHAQGARAIAEASTAAGVKRVVHVSGIGADDPRSANRFVASKAMAEHEMNRGFPAVTILRPSVVFGPGDKLFNALGAAVRMAPVMPLIGGGTARSQPVYAGDIGLAVAAALADDQTRFGLYELGGPRVYTFAELLTLTLRMTGRTKRTIGVPAWPFRIAAFFAEFLPVPPITRDQLDLLLRDNVVGAGRPGFAELGIAPRTAESILPSYLDRFRAIGRYDLAAPV